MRKKTSYERETDREREREGGRDREREREREGGRERNTPLSVEPARTACPAPVVSLAVQTALALACRLESGWLSMYF